MNLATQLKELKATTSLTSAERARHCCSQAKELERIGEYEAAAEALDEFWPHAGVLAIPDEIDQETKANLLLRIGSLTAWLGSTRQHSGSQETAKNLITQSIQIFEELEQPLRLAEARGDLALCYWREGALDEARVTLASALNSLGSGNSDLEAILLIRSGIIEVDSERLNEAFGFYEAARVAVEKSDNDALKGSFHMSFALLFKRLAAAEKREDYVDNAIIENTAASFHFERAGNSRYLASVESNLGFLLSFVGRFNEAHQHFDRARYLLLELKDVRTVAQVDDARARTFLAEGRLKEAERYAREAVRTLNRGDECSLLVEALTTHGTVKARLGKYVRARQLLDCAIETGETCGDLEGAGRARLSIIEELTAQNSPLQLAEIYDSAAELLKKSQDPSTTNRLIADARIVIDALSAGGGENREAIAVSWENFSLKAQVRSYEKSLIERALRDSGGAVTKAAHLLGFRHHQSLISLINSRHQDLLSQRSAVRPRRRHIFSKPRKLMQKRQPASPKRATSQVRILHVEDYKLVSDLVGDLLRAEKWEVELCSDGDSALRKLTSDEPYDVLVFDNDLSGLTGLDLAKRVRKISHRRRTPIVLLSADDSESEAWRAGVDAFLKKPEQVAELPATVSRLLREGHKPRKLIERR